MRIITRVVFSSFSKICDVEKYLSVIILLFLCIPNFMLTQSSWCPSKFLNYVVDPNAKKIILKGLNGPYMNDSRFTYSLTYFPLSSSIGTKAYETYMLRASASNPTVSIPSSGLNFIVPDIKSYDEILVTFDGRDRSNSGVLNKIILNGNTLQNGNTTWKREYNGLVSGYSRKIVADIVSFNGRTEFFRYEINTRLLSSGMEFLIKTTWYASLRHLILQIQIEEA